MDIKVSRAGYLVLGAGQLGMEVLRALAPRLGKDTSLSVVEAPPIVASNDPEHRARIEEIRALGAEILPLDLSSISKNELISAFAKFETVINCTGFVAGSGTQLRLTRAVIAGQVPRYIPWQFGVDYDVVRYSSPSDVFDEQYDVRLLLRAQSTTEWVIVSTGMFTSFLFEPAFGIVDLDRHTVHALGEWENRVTCTTPQDVGRLTAEIVLHEPRFVNTPVFVAGDTISYGELADLVDQETGEVFEKKALSLETLRYVQAASPGPMETYRAAFAQGDGMHWPKSETFNVQNGIETTTVGGWLHEHLRA